MSGWTQSLPFSGCHLVPFLQPCDEAALEDGFPEILPGRKVFSLNQNFVPYLAQLLHPTTSFRILWAAVSLSLPQILALLLPPLCLCRAATTPRLAKPLEPWGLAELVSDCLQHSILETPKAAEAGLELAQIICRGTSKGSCVVWHNRVSHLWRSRGPLASWKPTAAFPGRLIFYRRHVKLLSWLYSC